MLVAVGGFAFAFAMVPLYQIACEKVFGIKLEQGPAGEARARPRGDERLFVSWRARVRLLVLIASSSRGNRGESGVVAQW